jgi:DNA ligase-1
MIHTLADLFGRLSPGEARVAAYLLRGQVGPDYEGGELGMADKLVMRALATASGFPAAKGTRRRPAHEPTRCKPAGNGTGHQD